MISVFDHPWLGGLFADAEAQAIWAPGRQLAHMLTFEAAWSRALGAAGRVDSAMAETAACAIEAARPDAATLRAGTAADGLPVPALVRVLREAAGDAAGAVHAGATSQDVMDSALAMTLRDCADLLDRRLSALARALDALDARCGARPLTARTRMQAALPATVSNRLRAWGAPLPRHRTRLAELRPRVEVVQIGGPVGDRRDIAPAMVTDMARALGLGAGPCWHSARDGIAEFGALTALIAGSCGKIGQDICLMAQQGLNEIALSGGGGSSAMAHKRNPVRAELLVTLARHAAIASAAIQQAAIHEQERSGSAWALEWMHLPDLCVTTLRALAAATETLGDVTAIGAPDR